MSQDLISPLLLSMGIRDRSTLERLQVKAPVFLAMGLAPLKQARIEAGKAQVARAARVGRDVGVVNRRDFGHSLRLSPVRGRLGVVLREADVTVVDEPDEDDNGRIVRRARRADPLTTLKKYKSITDIQYAAGERLRETMERATATTGGWVQSDVHVAPWSRVGVTGRQIEATAVVRAAMAAVGEVDRLVITWIVLGGGTVSGAALYARLSDKTVAARLRSGLEALVEFFGVEEGLT